MAKEKNNSFENTAEAKALSKCIEAIKPLGQAEANRIIAYLQKRFTEQHDFS